MFNNTETNQQWSEKTVGMVEDFLGLITVTRKHIEMLLFGNPTWKECNDLLETVPGYNI